jgi:hypothetical protein
MSDAEKYLLDADSFIRSKREHYAPDFCPGFWDALLTAYRQQRVASIAPIRRELLKGKDALANWIKDEVPDRFFESEEDDDVREVFAEVVQWVEGNRLYSRAAKQKFVSGADPWLIAYARSNEFTVATYEVSSPESKALIAIAQDFRIVAGRCFTPQMPGRGRLRIGWGIDSLAFDVGGLNCRRFRCT